MDWPRVSHFIDMPLTPLYILLNHYEKLHIYKVVTFEQLNVQVCDSEIITVFANDNFIQLQPFNCFPNAPLND